MSNDSQLSINITSLAEYLEKVKDIPSLNKMMGPTYLKTFIEGQDVCGAMLAKAIREEARAKARLDQAKSIAYLEKATEYLQSKSIKVTDESRKKYVDIDPDVIKAQDQKNMLEAMVVLLKNKLAILRQSHDDVKKIIYGDQNQTPWEGM
jgi:hypothetical protein